MKNCKSYEEIKIKLEKILKEGLKKDNLIIYDDTFKLGLDYYFQELKDSSKKCVFGLSIKETLVVRHYFGFNDEQRELKYEEIKRVCEVRDISGIINYSLMMMRRNIKNINSILDKELKEEPKIYKTLLGELNLSKKTFGILQSHEIYTLGDLISYSKSELAKLRNIGKNSLGEIFSVVRFYGLKFKDEESNIQEEVIPEVKVDEQKNELENTDKEQLERKKHQLELKRLAIKYQRVTLYIEELKKEQQALEDEMKKLSLVTDFQRFR